MLLAAERNRQHASRTNVHNMYIYYTQTYMVHWRNVWVCMCIYGFFGVAQIYWIKLDLSTNAYKHRTSFDVQGQRVRYIETQNFNGLTVGNQCARRFGGWRLLRVTLVLLPAAGKHWKPVFMLRISVLSASVLCVRKKLWAALSDLLSILLFYVSHRVGEYMYNRPRDVRD